MLTDIVMPGMDGVALEREAAALYPQMKIMFITGFAAIALTPESKASEHASVVSKPFHLKDLMEQVDQALGRRESVEEIGLRNGACAAIRRALPDMNVSGPGMVTGG